MFGLVEKTKHHLGFSVLECKHLNGRLLAEHGGGSLHQQVRSEIIIRRLVSEGEDFIIGLSISQLKCCLSGVSIGELLLDWGCLSGSKLLGNNGLFSGDGAEEGGNDKQVSDLHIFD